MSPEGGSLITFIVILLAVLRGGSVYLLNQKGMRSKRKNILVKESFTVERVLGISIVKFFTF